MEMRGASKKAMPRKRNLFCRRVENAFWPIKSVPGSEVANQRLPANCHSSRYDTLTYAYALDWYIEFDYVPLLYRRWEAAAFFEKFNYGGGCLPFIFTSVVHTACPRRHSFTALPLLTRSKHHQSIQLSLHCIALSALLPLLLEYKLIIQT